MVREHRGAHRLVLVAGPAAEEGIVSNCIDPTLCSRARAVHANAQVSPGRHLALWHFLASQFGHKTADVRHEGRSLAIALLLAALLLLLLRQRVCREHEGRGRKRHRRRDDGARAHGEGGQHIALLLRGRLLG